MITMIDMKTLYQAPQEPDGLQKIVRQLEEIGCLPEGTQARYKPVIYGENLEKFISANQSVAYSTASPHFIYSRAPL